MKDNYSYARILKSTSVFGMVKLVGMVIGLIRSKFLAVLIGPAGYGILSLFQSTLDLIQLGTGLGIETSGIKNISNKEYQSDSTKIHKQVNLLVSLSVFLGIAGVIITVFLSFPLSQFTFGNSSYAMAFVWLSFSLIFKRLTLIQSTIFQGLNYLSLLAKANLWSNLIGFLVTLPLFFVFKIDAIVPSMLLSSVIAFLVSTFFYKRIKIQFKLFSFYQTFINSKDVLKFGILLSFSSFLALISNFLIQIFINEHSNIENVGLFNIGQVIINSYVGLIFSAMSTDYFPQLSSVLNDQQKVNEYVTKQTIFSLLVVTPIVLIFIILIPFLVPILFSKEFLPVIPMAIFLIGAMFFKSVSWSFGYLIIAKADSKVFIYSAVFLNFLNVFLCTYCFYKFGLIGIGYAFCMYFFTHLFFVFSIVKWRYSLVLSKELYKVFTINLFLILSVYFIMFHFEGVASWIGKILILTASIAFSFINMNKKIDIRSKIEWYWKKITKQNKS